MEKLIHFNGLFMVGVFKVLEAKRVHLKEREDNFFKLTVQYYCFSSREVKR